MHVRCCTDPTHHHEIEGILVELLKEAVVGEMAGPRKMRSGVLSLHHFARLVSYNIDAERQTHPPLHLPTFSPYLESKQYHSDIL